MTNRNLKNEGCDHPECIGGVVPGCELMGVFDGRPFYKPEECPKCNRTALLERVADLEEVLVDHKRLAREIDVAMHGEAGAAKQASLCDLIHPAAQRRDDLIHANIKIHQLKSKVEYYKVGSLADQRIAWLEDKLLKSEAREEAFKKLVGDFMHWAKYAEDSDFIECTNTKFTECQHCNLSIIHGKAEELFLAVD